MEAVEEAEEDGGDVVVGEEAVGWGVSGEAEEVVAFVECQA
ncbi:hypothetical protein [Amycolatopsis sp. NPDC001319]